MSTKTRLPAALCLALALSLPLAARAEDAAKPDAAKLEVAKSLVDKTVLKTLDTGFNVSLEKTVAALPGDKAEVVRQETRAEFDKERQSMLDGLSKVYADKFSLDELKRIQAVYDDPTYQKFQTMNADPKSEINAISQAGVTKLLTMLQVIAAANRPAGGEPSMNRQMQMPTPGR